MLVFKIDSRILYRLLRSIPPIEEFCILQVKKGDICLFCTNPENTVALEARILAGRFDYLVSNELSFALNLARIKTFFDGIARSDFVEAVFDEDSGFLRLSCGPLEREIRSLHPETVDMVPFPIPHGYEYRLGSSHAELSQVSRGLVQIAPRATVEIGTGSVTFSASRVAERFTYTRAADLDVSGSFELGFSAENLCIIAEHLLHARKVAVFLKRDSPLIISGDLARGADVRYLLANVVRV